MRILIILTLLIINSISASELPDDIFRATNVGNLKIDTRDALDNRRQISPIFNRDLADLIEAEGADDSYYYEGRRYFIPFNLTDSDRAKLIIAAGAGIIIFKNDEQIREFAQTHNTEQTEALAQYGKFFAEGIPTAMLGGIPYMVGMVIEDGELKEAGMLVVESALISGLTTYALKKSFRRVRPNAAETSDQFFEGSSNESFPSGHTTNAFSLATAISMTYGKESKIVPILAYGSATLAALSRIHDNMHWGTDVLAGAVIGHFVTKKFIETHKNGARKGIQITPVATANFTGLVFQYKEREPTPQRDCEKEFSSQEKRVRVCLGNALNRKR